MKTLLSTLFFLFSAVVLQASTNPIFPASVYQHSLDTLSTDTIPKNKLAKSSGTVKVMVDGDEFVINYDNDEVKKMKINGRSLTENELKENKATLDAIVKEIKRNGVAANYTLNIHSNNNEFNFYNGNGAFSLSKLAAIDGKRIAEESKRIAFEGSRIALESNRVEALGKRAEELGRKAAEEGKRAAEEGRKAAETSNNILQDLIDAEIITSKKDVYFKLSNTELVVNGKKQSDVLHTKMKNKYLKDIKGTIVYNDSRRSYISH